MLAIGQNTFVKNESVSQVTSAIFMGMMVFMMIIGIIILLIVIIPNFYGIRSEITIDEAVAHYKKNKNISDIIVTLTTTPKNISSKNMEHVIAHILRQNMKPKEIILYVPLKSRNTGEECIIPDWLKTTPVKIVKVTDMGPATKYLYALNEFSVINSNQRILVYSDESIMPPDMIELYNKYINMYPGYCIAAQGLRLKNSYRVEDAVIYSGKCHWLVRGLDRLFGHKNIVELEEDEYIPVDIVHSAAGYCLTPNMVQIDDLLNYKNMPQHAYYTDDIIMSGMLAKNNTRCIVCKQLESNIMTIETASNHLNKLLGIVENETSLGSSSQLYEECNTPSAPCTNDVSNEMIRWFAPYWLE